MWKLILEKRLKRHLRGEELEKVKSIGFKKSLKCIISKMAVNTIKTLPSLMKHQKLKLNQNQQNNKNAGSNVIKNKTSDIALSSGNNAKEVKINTRPNNTARNPKENQSSTLKQPPKRVEDVKYGSQSANIAAKSSVPQITKTPSKQKMSKATKNIELQQSSASKRST